MVKQKKTVGRSKKEFVSQKPVTKKKAWPGRPKKNKTDRVAPLEKITPEISSFVAKSVDDSKRKDLIILVLFLLSFLLFAVSLYYTFIKDKTPTQDELTHIPNIETGNIDYNGVTTIEEPEIQISIEYPETQEIIQPIVEALTKEQDTIIKFYQAINSVDMDTLYELTDTHLKNSNVFKTYYSKRWLSNFNEAIIAPKVVVTNIQEVVSTSENPDIKSFEYTLEYMVASDQKKFTEERSTTLIKKGDNRKVGKIMCETKWCSRMPFFNTEKYK